MPSWTRQGNNSSFDGRVVASAEVAQNYRNVTRCLRMFTYRACPPTMSNKTFVFVDVGVFNCGGPCVMMNSIIICFIVNP